MARSLGTIPVTMTPMLYFNGYLVAEAEMWPGTKPSYHGTAFRDLWPLHRLKDLSSDEKELDEEIEEELFYLVEIGAKIGDDRPEPPVVYNDWLAIKEYCSFCQRRAIGIRCYAIWSLMEEPLVDLDDPRPIMNKGNCLGYDLMSCPLKYSAVHDDLRDPPIFEAAAELAKRLNSNGLYSRLEDAIAHNDARNAYIAVTPPVFIDTPRGPWRIESLETALTFLPVLVYDVTDQCYD